MSATPLRGVAGVYRHIIDDVVTRVRTDFVQEGVDEAVLDELRELWESKLDDSGAIAAPPPVQAPQPGPAPQCYKPVHAPAYPGAAAAPAVDLSNFGKPEQYLQPTGFLPRPAVQQPAAGPYTAAPAPAGYASGPAAGIHNAAQPGTYAAQLQARHLAAAAPQGAYTAPPSGGTAQVGIPQQQQVPPQQQQQALPQQPQHAQQHFPQHLAAQQARRAQQYTLTASQPQQQYAPAVRPLAQLQQPAQQPEVQHLQNQQQTMQQQPQSQQQQQQQQQQQLQQPQFQHQQPASQPAATSSAPDARKRPFEGPDQGGPLSKQPYQQANGAAAVPPTASAVTIPQRDGNDDDEAGPSGGGGGDDAFAGSDEGEDPLAGLSSDDDADGEDIPNVVLAQFEKVSRTKTRVGTKWKCQMKNGIMHLNGRDIIFHKGNGEMQF